MSLDHTILQMNYKLMFESLHPLELEYMGGQSGILRSKLTWLEAKVRPDLLDRLFKHAESVGKTIWFQSGDPYTGSKPFEITWIGLENLGEKETQPTVILVVTGQKSARIKRKWTRKLAPFFGYQVSVIWEEDTQ